MSKQRSSTPSNPPHSQETQQGQGDQGAPSQENSYYQACFVAAIDAILIADDRGCYVDANSAACALFGLSWEALIGRCIVEFTQPRFDFDQAWQSFLAQGEERGEFSLVRPDGTVREVEYAATANVAPHRHLSILRDITDRKQLERQVQQLNQVLEQRVSQRTAELQQTNRALQITNQRLAAEVQRRERAEITLACAGDGMWDWNVQTHEVYFSYQWKAMLGYADDEIGNTLDEWHRRVHPDDRDHVYAALQEHFNGQTPIYQSEHRVLTKDGTWKWVLDRGKVVDWQPDGTPLRVIGTHVDITQRKQSEERLRLALEAARMGYWDWDLTTNEVIWSASLEQMMGLVPGTFDRRLETVVAMMHPDDRPRFFDAVSQSVETGAPYDTEFCFVKPDGTVRWAVGRGSVVRDATGRAVRLMGVDMDVTDRKEAEMRLREREATFRALAENTPDYVVRCDRQFRFLYANPAVARLNRLPVTAILGKTSQDLGWPDSVVHRWHQQITQVFNSGQMHTLYAIDGYGQRDSLCDPRDAPLSRLYDPLSRTSHSIL